nr:HAD family phosphatase [Sulfitobacter mediterraneus]
MHEELRDELELRGISMSFETCLTSFMGKSIEDVIDTAAQLGADLPSNWKAILYERVFERLKQGVEVIPGVPEFVARLKTVGIPFCVVSNGSEKKMQLMLSQHDLWDDFKDNCFSAHTVGIAKPDPGLLRYALDTMNARANQAVIIEDSEIGIKSAENADVPCLIYDPSFGGGSSAVHAKSRFSSMDEISSHLFSFIGDT